MQARPVKRFNKQQKQVLTVLSGLLLVTWLVVIALVGPAVYRLLSQPLPEPSLVMVTDGTPTPPAEANWVSIYQATWTPTPTGTATPTATPVDTYPPWATWTPTATFTPLPPTPTPLDHVRRKQEATAKYGKYFRQIAPKYDLDWRLMLELGYRESGLRPNARGRDGEYGMMQIMPYTWRSFSDGLDVAGVYDPRSNILVSAVYLSYLREACAEVGSTDEGCMLLAYNWGPNNMRRLYNRNLTWQNAPATQQRYVGDILKAAGYR